jgi:hypothetical protein
MKDHALVRHRSGGPRPECSAQRSGRGCRRLLFWRRGLRTGLRHSGRAAIRGCIVAAVFEGLYTALKEAFDDFVKGWRKDGMRGAVREASYGLWLIVVLLAGVGFVVFIVISD